MFCVLPRSSFQGMCARAVGTVGAQRYPRPTRRVSSAGAAGAGRCFGGRKRGPRDRMGGGAEGREREAEVGERARAGE